MSTPELSLRASKKERTRRDLLANAIALFREGGIRATRSSEIARAADVSPATLFNYFATRTDLVEAWVRGEIRAELASRLAEAGEGAIRPVLRAVARSLAGSSAPEGELRLEAWRLVGRLPSEDQSQIDSLRAAIERDQDRGRLRADLPAHALALGIVEALEGGMIAGLVGSSEAREVERSIRARVDLVLDGARKRNERVAPAARGAGWRVVSTD